MTTEKFIRNKTALVTLIAACLVVLISLGVRQTFGMFFMDFKNDLGISLTESGLSIGLQMLMWGLTGPIFGTIADKYGGHKAIALAFLFFIAGIYFSISSLIGQSELVSPAPKQSSVIDDIKSDSAYVEISNYYANIVIEVSQII